MKINLFTLILFCYTVAANSQSLDSSHAVQRFEAISGQIATISSKVDSNSTTIALFEKEIVSKPECTKKVCIGFWEWVLIFSPTVLVLFMLMFVKGILSSSKYPISEALQEVTIIPTTTTVVNSEGNEESTASAEISRGKSSSRVILFLAGIAALLLSSAICSYYFYFSLTEGEAPNIESLSKVLLSLGIGVAPYAVNKFSKALKK